MYNKENISINSDSVIKPIDKDDVKCAPGRKFEHGSCYKVDELIDIAKAYNNANEENKINLDLNIINTNKTDNKYDLFVENHTNHTNHTNYKQGYIKYDKKIKKYLVRQLTEKMKNKYNCKDQQCWVEQDFIKNLGSEKGEYLQSMVLRPEGPSTGRKWLNTENIDKVLKQYEEVYPDFIYLGTMPRDFQNHKSLRQDEKFYNELIKNGKLKMGMVYNTDKVGGSGEHWNALFVDFKAGSIEFFDSYGDQADVYKEVHDHMDLFKKIMQKNCANIHTLVNKNNLMKNGGEIECKIPQKKINKERAQYKGSECGVYSINFIESRLAGKTFDEICNAKIPDDEINKKRNIYFRKE